MQRNCLLIVVGLLAVALAVGAIACDGDEDEEGDPTPTLSVGETLADETSAGETPAARAATVNVTLNEWEIIPEVESVAVGAVTFNAENIGQEDHELVVIRTHLAPEALPTAEDGGVDETNERVEVIGEIEEFPAGEMMSAEFDLGAGSYVLICNIVNEEDGEVADHYQLGMRVAFQVTR